MNWIEQALDSLTRQPAIGYAPGGAVAAEPTAIAALALAAHGRREPAQTAADALVSMQGQSGAVGVRTGEPEPGWPTSLAIAAWSAVDRAWHRAHLDRAVAWLLANRGQAIDRSPDFGHDTQLVGWAYAEHTHSWVEPTAFAVIALKSAGQADHTSAREGVRVLMDRQLPGGGLNYGNTTVLGQLIRPHVQPTGIALVALAGEADAGGRIAKSLAWLRRNIGPETTPLSLGWAVLGLKAHGALPPQAEEWLGDAARKVAGTLRVPSLRESPRHDGTRSVPATLCHAHKLALLALAAKGWPA